MSLKHLCEAEQATQFFGKNIFPAIYIVNFTHEI